MVCETGVPHFLLAAQPDTLQFKTLCVCVCVCVCVCACCRPHLDHAVRLRVVAVALGVARGRRPRLVALLPRQRVLLRPGAAPPPPLLRARHRRVRRQVRFLVVQTREGRFRLQNTCARGVLLWNRRKQCRTRKTSSNSCLAGAGGYLLAKAFIVRI